MFRTWNLKVLRLLALIVVATQLFFATSLLAFADPTDAETESDTGNPITVLPDDAGLTVADCLLVMIDVEKDLDWYMNKLFKGDADSAAKNITGEGGKNIQVNKNSVLACGIKTGDISLWMIPYYVKEILEFILGLSGLVAVGGFVYGAYRYMFGGLVDDKETGKKAIMYAVGGMVLTLVAWGLVNIFISVVSSF